MSKTTTKQKGATSPSSPEIIPSTEHLKKATDEITETNNIKKHVDEIKVLQRYYPRSKVREDKIKEYSENIEVLPPITINQNDILIDGFHRLKAYIAKGIFEIGVVIEQCDDEKILERSIELNAKHGLQLSYQDKRRIAIEMFNGTNGKHLSQMLSVSIDCLNKWVRDIRKKKEYETEKSIISEYLKAEQSQEQVADKFGTSVRKVSETKKKFYEKINLLNHKKTKLLEEDRFAFRDILNFRPFISNVWEISGHSADNLSGWGTECNDYSDTVFVEPPAFVYENLLYYFTEPFDVVYVPFSGYNCSRITDVCKNWFRRHYLNNQKSEWGELGDTWYWEFADGLPKDLPPPKLVFIDNTADIEISELNALLIALKSKIKEDGHVVLLSTSDFDDKIVIDAGFKLKQRIVCTYSEDSYGHMQLGQAKADKVMVNLYRFLSVFTK